MKSSGLLSTMLLVTSLLFSGGFKTNASCGHALDALAATRADAPAVAPAPVPALTAEPAPDAQSVVDRYAVLAYI